MKGAKISKVDNLRHEFRKSHVTNHGKRLPAMHNGMHPKLFSPPYEVHHKLIAFALFVVHYLSNRESFGIQIELCGFSYLQGAREGLHTFLERAVTLNRVSHLRVQLSVERAWIVNVTARGVFFLSTFTRQQKPVPLSVRFGPGQDSTLHRLPTFNRPLFPLYHGLPKPLAMPSWKRNLTFCLQKPHEEGKKRWMWRFTAACLVRVAGISVRSSPCAFAALAHVRNSVISSGARGVCALCEALTLM